MAQPVSFQATVLVAAGDLSSMIAALDQLSAGPAASLPGVAAGVRAVAGELMSTLRTCSVLACGAGGSTPVPNELLECPKERALDIAAVLLDAATESRRAGRHLVAFALEGIEGRLLESLVTGAEWRVRGEAS